MVRREMQFLPGKFSGIFCKSCMRNVISHLIVCVNDDIIFVRSKDAVQNETKGI